MVVAGPEGFRKKDYRKFNIRSTELTPGDDFAMMREVLERRFKRLMNEAPRQIPSPVPGEDGAAPSDTPGEGRVDAGILEPLAAPKLDADGIKRTYSLSRPIEGSVALLPLPPGEREDEEDSPWPDLVLIDGGLGQLNAAREILEKLGAAVPLAAIAKGPDRDAGRETFFLPGPRLCFKLPPRDPVLYFVERLRDEAHRFAVGSHRTRRRTKDTCVRPACSEIGRHRADAQTGTAASLRHAQGHRARRCGFRPDAGRRHQPPRRRSGIYAFFHDGAA